MSGARIRGRRRRHGPSRSPRSPDASAQSTLDHLGMRSLEWRRPAIGAGTRADAVALLDPGRVTIPGGPDLVEVVIVEGPIAPAPDPASERMIPPGLPEAVDP